MSAGLIKRIGDGLRLLGNGELKTKVVVEAIGATKGAFAGIEKAGGSINLIKVVDNRPVENTRDASEST